MPCPVLSYPVLSCPVLSCLHILILFCIHEYVLCVDLYSFLLCFSVSPLLSSYFLNTFLSYFVLSYFIFFFSFHYRLLRFPCTSSAFVIPPYFLTPSHSSPFCLYVSTLSPSPPPLILSCSLSLLSHTSTTHLHLLSHLRHGVCRPRRPVCLWWTQTEQEEVERTRSYHVRYATWFTLSCTFLSHSRSV
jgi:hypothetical protein